MDETYSQIAMATSMKDNLLSKEFPVDWSAAQDEASLKKLLQQSHEEASTNPPTSIGEFANGMDERFEAILKEEAGKIGILKDKDDTFKVTYMKLIMEKGLLEMQLLDANESDQDSRLLNLDQIGALKSMQTQAKDEFKKEELQKKLNNTYIHALNLLITQNGLIALDNGSKLNQVDLFSNEEDHQILGVKIENLIFEICSIAAQKNLVLPQPVDSITSLEGKLTWISSCLREITFNETLTRSKSLLGSKSKESTKNSVSDLDLQTALKDLQFSYEYLSRQFENEKLQHSDILSQMRYKLNHSEELLSKLTKDFNNQTNTLVQQENQINQLSKDLAQREKEINDLNKELSISKIDSLGIGENTKSGSKSPLGPNSPKKNNVSATILRSEFKKLVRKINERHEQQLNEERNERQRLETLVKIYEENMKK
ncbi:Hypothetical protein PP7435_CHR1-0049 [Komagataella phaffii CBS 7435]|uniref:Uncharacterized protein n=2 Tax=Komagataella phaffii TaxID=460519 RepID=C4QV34_KOMPG|nr:uncharacterized protein PAS_chr1-3_0291 [Komagataella phaffii GS115]AOA61528.1 GQ67_02305T0 [Komagataella phaffii]CAH2445759.1 Hypothetical protein BQ9382_C1-0240 [Komagataella phaffii CBS 7435]AOA66553.1 GQ68_02942T0 [Komagataella phaffii GS115]CAY67104.1 hypothetical protein PAS_chr1-3_0291 [Komagataella phaffii GS115]CCA36218.1 Hypothetical protein PP7435_CHR1-0049 [Komagataella phaffii CBS 7435]